MSFTQLLSLAVFAIFTENVVLTQFLGVRSFLGSSGKMGPALGTGLTVTLVTVLASLFTWAVNAWLLVPCGLDGFLQIPTFILIIFGLVRLLNLLLKKMLPTLHTALASVLPLITTNCAVLGMVLLNTENGYGAMTCAAHGLFGGLGFTLAIVLFACVRERLEFANCPKAFEGAPIALVTAGLLAMAFMGFSGLRL